MTSDAGWPGRQDDIAKTYLYLRVGIIGAVVLLFTSIIFEYFEADCWQTSISAYYYTPVRAIFVGTLFAVGLALIVYRGQRVGEDFFLNLAGMFAPIVAVAPTTNVNAHPCWSIEPEAQPVLADGSLAPWVGEIIQNNMYALLIVGTIGLIFTFLTTIGSLSAVPEVLSRTRTELLKREEKAAPSPEARELMSTLRVLGAAVIMLASTWVLVGVWENFDTLAHGYAAVLFFGSLIGAIFFQWRYTRTKEGRGRFARAYLIIAILMVAIGALSAFLDFGDYEIAWLELVEIVIFAVYWIVQTWEKHRYHVQERVASSVLQQDG